MLVDDNDSDRKSVHAFDGEMLKKLSDIEAPKASRIMYGIPTQIYLGTTKAGVKLYLQKPEWNKGEKIWDHWKVLDARGGDEYLGILDYLAAGASDEVELAGKLRGYFDLSKVPAKMLTQFSIALLGCREIDGMVMSLQEKKQTIKAKKELAELENVALPWTFKMIFKMAYIKE